MIVLIVPGVILAIRWNIAVNFVISGKCGPTEALNASWNATRGSAWAIFGVMILLGVVKLAGRSAIGIGFGNSVTIASAPLLAANSLYAGALSAVGLCVPIATYALLAKPAKERLSEIFT